METLGALILIGFVFYGNYRLVHGFRMGNYEAKAKRGGEGAEPSPESSFGGSLLLSFPIVGLLSYAFGMG